jgi:hypothetical protein
MIFLFLASTVMFSCQRNGGGNANDVVETPNGSTENPSSDKQDGPPTQADLDGYNPNSGNTILSDDTSKKSMDPKVVFYYNVLLNSDGTYGYEIIENEKVIISQPTIPGNSSKGFAEKLQAANAGELIVKKILAGQEPVLSESEIQGIIK